MAKVALVSGYKAYELGIFKQNHPAAKYIKSAIARELKSLQDEGLEWVVITGQPGVELWAGQVVCELQEDWPELKLSVITPFLDQENKWSEANREWYESVVMDADHVDSVSRKPYENPQQLKAANQFLVNKSDVLILVYDEIQEGSPRFFLKAAKERAEKQQYEIRLIGFDRLQEVVEEETANWD